MTAETSDRDSTTTDAPPEARYVNYFAVGFNAVEIVLDFGQAYSAARPPPGVRLVMSPIYAKQFLSMLAELMGDYEKAFGRLDAR